jgi:ribonuclease P protein component
VPASLPLPRKQRLRASEFQSVFQERSRRVERPGFVAVWRPRAGPIKVGFAVGRRVGGAVVRNRARRRLREAYRRLRSRPADGFAVVFVGRAALLDCSFSELSRDMEEALRSVERGVSGTGGSASRGRAR